MKPEDVKVGGLYTWRNDFDYALGPNVDVGPFLVTSITAHGDPHQATIWCIGPGGRPRRWGLGVAERLQPLE